MSIGKKAVYYPSSYKILYDKFLKIVSNPLFSLDDIKFEDFFNPKKNNMASYKCYVERILSIFIPINAKMRYISSGSTGHFFKGVILKDANKPLNDKNNIECYFALKMTPYLKCSKYKDIYEINRPENTELHMLKCLSFFVLDGQTRHLLLPVQSFYCPINEFIKMMKINKVVDDKNRYQNFINNYNNQKYENIVSVMVTELASEGDFLNYIRNNLKSIKPLHWKIFFFQLLSVLAIIQLQFPAFRHNDLKANNILLHKDNMAKREYRINHKVYITPAFNLLIKIWDFDFACIPGIVDNIKVQEKWTKAINITTEQNRYYDIHFFFYTLEMFLSKVWNNKYIDQETLNFVDDVVPKKYKSAKYATDKGRLLINDEYITPLYLIENHKYFDEFRIK